MDDYNGTHIPAFGNWDYDQSSPITQYFESARQAGLLRYNYGEGDVYSYIGQYEQHRDLYMQPTHSVAVAVAPPRRKSKTNESQEKKSHVYSEAPRVKELKKQGKVYDVEQTAKQQQQQQRVGRNAGRAPKAVDEDLYKIPPELLYSKKKKAFGFLSRCLVPSCAA